MDNEIEKLLELQEKDTTYAQKRKQLDSVPKEIQSQETHIDDIQKNYEQKEQEVKNTQKAYEQTQSEREKAEQMIRNYKHQQLHVKKNDEYQALTHEIESSTEKAASLEEKELQLMMDLESANQELEKTKEETEQQIQKHRNHIQTLKEREKKLGEELENLEKEMQEQRETISKPYIDAYDHSKSRNKRPPYVVPIVDHKAGGLKVSGDTESQARKKNQVVIDEMIGKVVYIQD